MVDEKTNAKETVPAPPSSAKRVWKHVVEWIPYPIALAVGWYAFAIEVKKSIYANVAKKGFFTDLKKEVRDTTYGAVLDRGAVDGKSVAGELHDIEEKYVDVIKKKFETKLGMKGIADYWHALQRHQRISALVLGATVTSIVLGAVFLVKENEVLKDALERRDKQQQTQRA